MNFRKLLHIMFILILVVIILCFLNYTYSKYVIEHSIDTTTQFAEWTVALKNDVTPLENNFDLLFNLSSNNNKHISNGKIAPGVTGEAKLILDLTGTEVSVEYNITADTSVLEKQIGASNIKMEIRDDSGNEIKMGKSNIVRLIDNNKFNFENGKININFLVQWDNAGDELSVADTKIGQSIRSFKIPITVKIKQYIENGNSEDEAKKITTNMSYVESLATKDRSYYKQIQNSIYDFDTQDALNTNPDRGFYNATQIVLNENGLSSGGSGLKSNISNLLYLGVDISAFSGAINKESDKELTSEALDALRNVLEKIKQNNNTVILRFCYDSKLDGDLSDGIAEGTNNAGEILYRTEPDQSMIIRHISQLGPVLKEYATTINTIQIGLYGKWGEAHSSSMLYPESYANENIAGATRAFLAATSGTDITIAVRKPSYYAAYAEINENNIDSDITIPSQEAYRVGIFNDGYLGSESDLGTYSNREKTLIWLNNQSSHSTFGGEAVVDANTGEIGKYNSINNVMKEAFITHTSYLNFGWNQELHKAWTKEIYNGEDKLYTGLPALTYIDNHLGYRFVVKEVRTYEETVGNTSLPIDISVENVGFANLCKNKVAQIILTDANGSIIKTYDDVDINAKDFLSRTTISKSVNIDLPELLSGEYKIYLRLSNGEILKDNTYYASIKFANDNIYDEKLQANYLGKFIVK